MPPVLAAIPAAIGAAAAAGGAAALFGTAASFTFLGLTGAWAVAAATGLLSLAMGTIQNLLIGNPHQAEAQLAPTKLSFRQDSQEQRVWGYGTVTSPGTLKYWETTSTGGMAAGDNKTLWFVCPYHDTPIDSVLNFYCDGKLETFTGANATGNYAGVMSRYDKLGAIDQAAETNLNAASTIWTGNHRLCGTAYYVWKL